MSSTTKTWILIFIAIIGSTLAKAPEYILPCKRADPELNSCLRNTINHLKTHIGNGLQELGVPPMEPLEIKELIMENNGTLKVKARFSNIIVKGASSYTVREVRADAKKLRIDLSLDIPRLEVTGKYQVNGKLVLVPVASHGDFWAEFSDITVLAKVYGQEHKKGGKIYMFVKKLSVDFVLKDPKFKITIQDASEELVKGVNQYLNKNGQMLIQKMRPTASKAIAKHMKKIVNKAFSNIELKDLLTK